MPCHIPLQVVTRTAVLLSVLSPECCILLPQQGRDLLCHLRFSVCKISDAFLGGYVFNSGTDVTENSADVSLYVLVREPPPSWTFQSSAAVRWRRRQALSQQFWWWASLFSIMGLYAEIRKSDR